MRHALVHHPRTPCPSVGALEVAVARGPGCDLKLGFFLSGQISNLRLPPAGAIAREDGLWQHTCFEVFVCNPTTGAYVEFNFAPSRQWAGYHFSGYRQDMRPLSEIPAPQLEIKTGDKGLQLHAALSLEGLAEFEQPTPWHLGLSAVIEDTQGRVSYWALTHPPGRADFHCADCFALELGAEMKS